MAIQMYNYFEDILRKGSAEEDLSQKLAEEQSAQLLAQLQQEVYSLKHRLEELEKVRGMDNEMSLYTSLLLSTIAFYFICFCVNFLQKEVDLQLDVIE